MNIHIAQSFIIAFECYLYAAAVYTAWRIVRGIVLMVERNRR